jgi:molybdate transport system regulatory protein
MDVIRMQPKYKIWLEEGDYVFGDGVALILENVDRHGSICEAARQICMSYRHVWGTIRKAEKCLGYDLLIKRIGGDDGGGAELTPRGKEMLQKYLIFRRDIDRKIKASFRRCFAGK